VAATEKIKKPPEFLGGFFILQHEWFRVLRCC
jgi:hypothetical protein